MAYETAQQPVAPDAADCAVNRVRFLTAGRPERNRVRPAILASWERSRELGIAADKVHVPYLHDPDADSPLTRSADPVLARLSERLAGQSVSIILTDPAGLVLSRRTPDAGFERQLDRVLLAPGFTYAERFAGTNGIGTALQTGRATQVLGHEHYAENLERLACAAVPIRHPVSGRIAGILDLTCWRTAVSDTDPLLLTLAETTAEQIQQAMLTASCPDELAVLAAYRQAGRRCADAVLAIVDDAVLLNDRARRELDVADQAVLVARAGEIAATLPAGRRRTVDIVLSGGRPARVHCLAVGARSRADGIVVRVRIGDRPAADATAPTPRPLSGLVGHSVLWRQVTSRATALHAAGSWLVLRGEPGTGKSALAQALARAGSSRTLVLDGRDTSAWPAPLGTALGDARQIVVAHLDDLERDERRMLTGLLDACGPATWVVATSGTRPAPPGDELLRRFPHVLDVPALRLRPDDIPVLATHFLDGGTCSADALRVLVRAEWPGNVAQLRAAMQHVRRTGRRRGSPVERDELPGELHSTTRRTLTPLESIERDAIVAALTEADGVKERAARALGISRATIYRRINDYGIRA